MFFGCCTFALCHPIDQKHYNAKWFNPLSHSHTQLPSFISCRYHTHCIVPPSFVPISYQFSTDFVPIPFRYEVGTKWIGIGTKLARRKLPLEVMNVIFHRFEFFSLSYYLLLQLARAGALTTIPSQLPFTIRRTQRWPSIPGPLKTWYQDNKFWLIARMKRNYHKMEANKNVILTC